MTKIPTKTSKIPKIPPVSLKYRKYPKISKMLYEEKMNNICKDQFWLEPQNKIGFWPSKPKQ